MKSTSETCIQVHGTNLLSCAVDTIRFMQILIETKYLSSGKDWADWLLLNQKCYEPAKQYTVHQALDLTELSNVILGSP